MTFGEQRRKAFDFCADATKQLITLSTGIVAFMVTFAKDFVTTVSEGAKYYAYIAWGLHAFAIFSGIVVLLALTAQLEPRPTVLQPEKAGSEPTILGAAATYSKIQIISFCLAMLFTIAFGVMAAQTKPVLPRQTVLEKQILELGGRIEKLQAELVIFATRQQAFQQELRTRSHCVGPKHH